MSLYSIFSRKYRKYVILTWKKLLYVYEFSEVIVKYEFSQ